MVGLTESTGYEYAAGFGSRVVGYGEDSWTQYSATVQAQKSHMFGAVVFMPKGYRAMMSTSGYVLRIHSHGLSFDAVGNAISANEMDKKYKALGIGARIQPNVSRQNRHNFLTKTEKQGVIWPRRRMA